jgi:hypothetical protein
LLFSVFWEEFFHVAPGSGVDDIAFGEATATGLKNPIAHRIQAIDAVGIC